MGVPPLQMQGGSQFNEILALKINLSLVVGLKSSNK
jgi:hypothetical protein